MKVISGRKKKKALGFSRRLNDDCMGIHRSYTPSPSEGGGVVGGGGEGEGG